MEPGAASRVAHGQVFSWQLLREPAVSLICLDVPCSECRQNKRQGGRVLRMLTSFFDSAARVCRTPKLTEASSRSPPSRGSALRHLALLLLIHDRPNVAGCVCG